MPTKAGSNRSQPGSNVGVQQATRQGHNPPRPSLDFRPDSAKLRFNFIKGSKRTDCALGTQQPSVVNPRRVMARRFVVRGASISVAAFIVIRRQRIAVFSAVRVRPALGNGSVP
jgi:hypothetical protein